MNLHQNFGLDAQHRRAHPYIPPDCAEFLSREPKYTFLAEYFILLPNMTGRGGGGRRVLLPPINMIFKLLQTNSTVSVWLYEQLGIRIEGKIRGFDEFMNLVLDDAVEVRQITKTNDKESRRPLGQILLKGDNVSLIQNLSE
ncbi:small nuclear ribonucleoprotein E [Cordyceps militaris CM01]|uniref:Small nuclear ribonucleoprotein E n=4 Tax=Cordycipitaceae TaxID=474943 RepID=G3JAL0_CORMM|nr:small nuclear ribonucleoprotein E [Cordyceps militaris CM01]EGX94326.1 small nuclear ribonucleoprotein E [Cordyceps militaris CM01]